MAYYNRCLGENQLPGLDVRGVVCPSIRSGELNAATRDLSLSYSCIRAEVHNQQRIRSQAQAQQGPRGAASPPGFRNCTLVWAQHVVNYTNSPKLLATHLLNLAILQKKIPTCARPCNKLTPKVGATCTSVVHRDNYLVAQNAIKHEDLGSIVIRINHVLR